MDDDGLAGVGRRLGRRRARWIDDDVGHGSLTNSPGTDAIAGPEGGNLAESGRRSRRSRMVPARLVSPTRRRSAPRSAGSMRTARRVDIPQGCKRGTTGRRLRKTHPPLLCARRAAVTASRRGLVAKWLARPPLRPRAQKDDLNLSLAGIARLPDALGGPEPRSSPVFPGAVMPAACTPPSPGGEAP